MSESTLHSSIINPPPEGRKKRVELHEHEHDSTTAQDHSEAEDHHDDHVVEEGNKEHKKKLMSVYVAGFFILHLKKRVLSIMIPTVKAFLSVSCLSNWQF